MLRYRGVSVRRFSSGAGLASLRLTLLVFGLLCTGAGAAQAHGVVVWAEVAGPEVLVEAHYTSGTKLSDARVEVLDAGGRILITGQTDSQGRFAFRPPRAEDLVVEVRDRGDHRGRFEIKAAEIEAGLKAGASAQRE